MDSLPRELLESILLFNVRMCRCKKNALLPLRLVCKDFDAFLKPYALRALQLEFTKFLRDAPTPKLAALETAGKVCQAVYIDVMVIRDEDEISRLLNVFGGPALGVPEMERLLPSLKRYSMNENSFDETDFRKVVDSVFLSAPNMTRLKVNLPFQVIGRASSTATLLLATTLACIASRPVDEYKSLETLVLDHVSDTTLISICNNPIDLLNALTALGGLKNMVLTIKRQEAREATQATFTANLWFLIRKARKLESLCLIGWNTPRNTSLRMNGQSVTDSEWPMRSMPYNSVPTSQLRRLRYLELKRVDIFPRDLLDLIEEHSQTLKEIYLIGVYLKIMDTEEEKILWIGAPGQTLSGQVLSVAQGMRNMDGLQLDILRATGLGYDILHPGESLPLVDYDLKDPSMLDRSFDERFVEAVFAPADTPMSDSISSPTRNGLDSEGSATLVAEATSSITPRRFKKMSDWNAETYQARRNVTSHYKRSIDGLFLNHNRQASVELQSIMTLANRGMDLISGQLWRSQNAQVSSATGQLDNPFASS